MARDDFTKSDKSTLCRRVNGRCSNPDCRASTMAGNQGDDGVTSIGIAAHITAASPGGARYDPALTSAQRRSLDNGIWLCSPCATTIDRDKTSYAVELLRRWRTGAVADANLSLGQPARDPDEVVNTLSAVFSGSAPGPVLGAIRNVHVASNRALEALDPRLAVDSSHVGGVTTIAVSAKVDAVPFRLTVDTGGSVDHFRAFLSAVEDGSDAQIAVKRLHFEGSPLLEHIGRHAGSGHVRVSSPKLPVTMLLRLTDSAAGRTWEFDELHGTVSRGTRSVSTDVAACEGIVTMSVRASPSVQNANKLDLRILVEKWVGIDIRQLPYWDSVSRLVSGLVRGPALAVELRHRGRQVTSGTCASPELSTELAPLAALLSYTAAAREIARVVNEEIPFCFGKGVDFSEWDRVSHVAAELAGGIVLRAEDVVTSPRVRVVPKDGAHALKERLRDGTVGTFLIEESVGEELNVFGRRVRLPARSTTFRSVTPRLVAGSGGTEPADEVEIDLVFGAESCMEINYYCD